MTEHISTMRHHRRRYVLCIAAVTFVAILMRILHVRSLYCSPGLGDAPTYLDLSRIFDEGIWSRLNYFPVGYPFFLHVLRRIFGLGSINPILYVQAVLGGLMVPLVASIARHVAGARAALLAAGICAFYRHHVMMPGLVMSEFLSMVTVTLAVWAFVHYCRRPCWWRVAVAGVFCAAATHARTNLVFVTAALTWLTLLPGRHLRAAGMPLRWRLFHALMVAMIGLGLLVPWSVRNSILAKRPTGLSTNSGLALYIAHNPVTDNMDWQAEVPDWYVEKMLGRKGVRAYQDFQGAAEFGRRFLLGHIPYELLYLLPRRATALFHEHLFCAYPWDDWYVSSTHSTMPFGPYLWCPLIPSAPVLLLGLLGMLIPVRRCRWLIPFVLLFSLGPFLAFHTEYRYRTVFDQFFIVTAGAALDRIIGRRADFRCVQLRTYLAVAVVVIVASVVNVLRFAGPNLLEMPRAVAQGGAVLSQMAGAGYRLNLHRGYPGKAYRQDLGVVAVDPGNASHLLFEFDFRIVSDQPPSRRTLDIALDYYDETGTTVSVPMPCRSALMKWAFLNAYQATGEHAWRVIRIPPLTRHVRMRLFYDGAPATIEISRFRIGGPLRYRDASSGRSGAGNPAAISRPGKGADHADGAAEELHARG